MMGAAKEGVQELSSSLATKALKENRGSRTEYFALLSE